MKFSPSAYPGGSAPRKWLAHTNATQRRSALVLLVAETASLLLLWAPFASNFSTNAMFVVWTAIVPLILGAVLGFRVLDLLALLLGFALPIAIAGLIDGGSWSAAAELLSAVVVTGYVYGPITIVTHLIGAGGHRAFGWWRSLPA